MNLQTENEFISLINNICSDFTGRFSTNDLFKKLKIKSPMMKNIVREWLLELIENNRLGFQSIGKDKKGKTLLINKKRFTELMRKELMKQPFLLNENQTYNFLQSLAGSKDFNIGQLRSSVENTGAPLVRFDEGSRKVPIMLNLYKHLVPERKVYVSHDVVNMMYIKHPDSKKKSKPKKGSLFSKDSEKPAEESPRNVITTAFTLLFSELGKLIITKKEVTESRAYKVYFSALDDYKAFLKLLKEIYDYSPVITDDFISLFPENWLDPQLLQKRLEPENTESLEKFAAYCNRFLSFLNQDEIQVLYSLIREEPAATGSEEQTAEETSVQEEVSEKEGTSGSDTATETETDHTPTKSNPEVLEKEVTPEKETTADGSDTVNEDAQTEETEPPEAPTEKKEVLESLIVDDTKKKKKPQEPAEKKPKKEKNEKKKNNSNSFLDSMIIQEEEKAKNENEPKQEQESEEEIAAGIKFIDHTKESKEEPVPKPTEREELETADLNKAEKHILIRIVESTNISSGYFLFDREEKEDFKDLINRLRRSKEFILKDEADRIKVKRNNAIPASRFRKMKTEAEEAIMKDGEEEPDARQKKEATPDSDKQATEDHEEKELQEKMTVETNPDDIQPGEFDEDFLVDEEEESDNNSMDEGDVSKETPDLEDNQSKPEEEKEEETTKKEREKTENENQAKFLEGKVISILTEDEEAWLKIEMLSKMHNFEIRDGLAYSPDIAVFDQEFKHLEPIAKNSGALVMDLKTFKAKLGLS